MRRQLPGRACLPSRAAASLTLALATAAACSGPTARTSSLGGSGAEGGSGGGGGSAGTAGSGGSGGSSGGGAGGSTAAPDAGMSMGGASGGLPVVVTSVFNNQGWFADPSVSASFAPGSTVIKQGDAVTGPCAARDPSAHGKCLKIVYTPPAGLVPPPAGGYVGVFFLPTLLHDHPEATPPAMVGDANWGIEPGVAMPAGAARISFKAAGEVAGLQVVFKAGTDRDSFLIPETAFTLGTTWTSESLSLANMSYGASVIGGFAWVLSDTTKPATFYLDDIVWE